MTVQRLKIIHFSKDLPSDKPNGVSCQVHRLANALVDKGHTVACVSYSPKPDDSRYIHLRLLYKSPWKIVRKLEPGFTFQSKTYPLFDILHFHGDDYLVPESRPMVRTFYGTAACEALFSRSFSRFLYQTSFFLFEWMSLLKREMTVGISDSNKKFLPLIKHTINCGVPTELFKPGSEKTEHPSLLFCGDLTSRKNGNFLLSLFHDFIRPALPTCTLCVISPQYCEGPNIQWYPQVKESMLISLYQKSWLYCMVSTYEGFGVPAIEAMACGTPVVALPNGNVETIIHHTYTGMIVDKNTYADTVITLLQHKQTRDELSINCIALVHQKYSIQRIVQQYEELYDRIVSFNKNKQ